MRFGTWCVGRKVPGLPGGEGYAAIAASHLQGEATAAQGGKARPVVYDVMYAREAVWPGYGPSSAQPADPGSSSPQPGWPARGADAGSGTAALTALPRRVQAPSASSRRASAPDLTVLQRVLRGLERL